MVADVVLSGWASKQFPLSRLSSPRQALETTDKNFMDVKQDYYGHSRPGSETYNNSRKPQLPNFDHFLRSTGAPELTCYGPGRSDTAFSSSSHGQSSLPTPPATGGPSWLDGSQHEQHYESQYAVVDDMDYPQAGPHRRASLLLPFESRPQPRPVPAYSSMNANLTNNNAKSWQPGQVVHEEHVPGKGLCYVYDDGSTCPKEVDGDVVNPKWGTTKAGKPRKRLGQACNTCREKKIKCDPSYPKCSQCQRFNRECRFDTNSRQGRKSPKFRSSTCSPSTTSAYSPEQCASRRSSIAPTEASTPTDAVHNIDIRTSVVVDDTPSPAMSEKHVIGAPTPSKRQRLSDGLTDRSVERTLAGVRHSETHSYHQHGFSAHSDPVLVDESLSKGYLVACMDLVNMPTCEILPRNRFLDWAFNNQNKSLCEKIVLYAMMTMGCTQSTGPDRVAHRQIFKKIVYKELDYLEAEFYGLEFVHILLFLSFADFVDADQKKGFGTFVRAVGCISWLELSLEPVQPPSNLVYGFPSDVHAECCRRTYWAAFSSNTYTATVKGDPRLLNKSDIYLKLPCASHFYNNGRIPNTPFFDQENVLPKILTAQDHLKLGDMAYFLQITTIFSDIQLNAWHSRQSLRVGSQHHQERSVREKLEGRLKTWVSTYEEALRVREGRTPELEKTSCKPLKPVTRIQKSPGLDLLYHYAMMELNRRIYHQRLTEAEILQHAKTANLHAVEVLKLAHQVMTRGGPETEDYMWVTRGPLGGSAVFTAIDIITAAGRNGDVLANQSKIMELMYASLDLLEKRSNYWSSDEVQRDSVKERIQTVFSTAQTALGQRKMFFYCTNPMTPFLEREMDLIYGTDRKQYLRAAYGMNNSINDAEIYAINTRSTRVGAPPA